MFKKISLILLAIVLSVTAPNPLLAITEEQRTALGQGVYYFNTEEDIICDASTGSVVLSGKDNLEKTLSYLMQKGLTLAQAAGAVGNLMAESGMIPNNQENSKIFPSGGWGIAQWTADRRTTLVKEMKSASLDYLYVKPPSSSAEPKLSKSDNDKLMAFELDFLWGELNGTEKKAFADLKQQKTPQDAAYSFHYKFERSKDSPAKYQRREDNAVTIYNQYKDAPPIAGSTTPPTSKNDKAVIFIDPGHGGEVPQYVDAKTKLADRETANSPEREDVLNVANRTKAELEKAGYSVVLGRTSAAQKINKRQRVSAAEAAKTDLAISLHTTPGELNQVWPQRTGTYREYQGTRVTFSNRAVADQSEQFANIFAAKRTEAEGHKVTTDPGNVTQMSSLSRDGVPSKGNLSLVQLWATNTPWVYNEIGQDSGTSISEKRKQQYTKGIVAAVKQAISTDGTNSENNNCGGQFSGGDISQTTLAYAWPKYRGNTVVAKPEYVAAYQKARSVGEYIGGTSHPGIDCGGFVTRLILNSGFDPTYNYSGKIAKGAGYTAVQDKWLRANWSLLGTGGTIDAAEFRPGDVAIKSTLSGQSGHTFVYVGEGGGKKIAGFDSVIASASLNERAPMAGTESITDSAFRWYRKN